MLCDARHCSHLEEEGEGYRHCMPQVNSHLIAIAL